MNRIASDVFLMEVSWLTIDQHDQHVCMLRKLYKTTESSEIQQEIIQIKEPSAGKHRKPPFLSLFRNVGFSITRLGGFLHTGRQCPQLFLGPLGIILPDAPENISLKLLKKKSVWRFDQNHPKFQDLAIPMAVRSPSLPESLTKFEGFCHDAMPPMAPRASPRNVGSWRPHRLRNFACRSGPEALPGRQMSKGGWSWGQRENLVVH